LSDFSLPLNVKIDFAVAHRDAVERSFEIHERLHYLTSQHETDHGWRKMRKGFRVAILVVITQARGRPRANRHRG
jgi:hypothetical protein